MKRIILVGLAVILLVGSGYSKEKKLTESQTKIAEFKKERGDLFTNIKQYEDAIQNSKYRIAQLNFGIELLEDMEKTKGEKKK